MGTVKYTGPVASFHCPTEATIRSLKVHFSPKQLGSGDPSPENVREIEGWGGVEVYSYPDVNISIDNIPNEYKKINYLQSSGTQYIDTLVSGGNSTTHPKYEIIFTPLNSTLSFQQYFAGERAPQGIPKLYKDNIRSTCVVQKAGIGTKDCNIAYNEISKIVASEDLCEVNGIDIEFDSSEALNGWGSSSWYIFNSHSEPTLASNMRLYGLKMWSDEVLIRNFVPCRRESDDKPGMYDTVSQTFFTNQGTGEFICGPDIGETVEYEFGVLGKNKVPFLVDSKTISSQINGNAGWCNVWKIPNKNLKYTYSAYIDNTNNTNTANITVWLKNIDNTSYVDGTAKSGTQVAAGAVGRSTITLDASTLSNTYYFVFGITSFIKSGETASCTFSNPMVEIGDTATTYEPYNPNKTVYGGWVDLISGEVQEEWAKVTMEQYTKAAEMHESPGENIYSADFGLPYIYGCLMSDVRLSKCNCLEYNSVNGANTFKLRYFVNGRDGFDAARKFDVNVYSETPLDETGIRDYLANINFELYYKTTAPMNTYNLAPLEMQTFLAQNNIWSNADYVEVEYDLHETQNILARKQFIMANQPHVVKPAAAPLQNFVTDVPAPLKECKVHFSPVQKGEGNPSPENARAISWWMAIVIEQSGKNLFNALNATSNTSIWTFSEGTWSTSYVESGNSTHKWGNQIFAPGTYTFSAKFSEPGVRGLRFLCSSPTCNGTWDNTYQGYWKSMVDEEKITFSVTEPCKIGLVFLTATGHVGEAGTAYNIQLEKGSVATYYEPYSGAITPIIFPSEAGTIYGGYVDLINGEIVQEWYTISIDETASMRVYTPDARNQGTYCEASYWLSTFNAPNAASYEPYSTDGYCNILPYIENNYTNEARATAYNSVAAIYLSGVKTQEEYLAWVAEYGPIIICYRLATPIHYTLTPTQLKALRGANNIWAFNGGDNIEIAYWKH